MPADPLRRKVRPLQKRKRRKPLSEEIRSMTRVLSFTLLFLGVTTIFSYLYLNSLKPAKGYQLKQLEIEQEQLESEQRDLERQIIEAQSFLNLEGKNEVLEMDAAEEDDFSYVEDSNYAQNTGNSVTP
ncbi:MAG: hypothetical protein AAB802_04920 [Patescibacteria group bacterium]